MHTFFTVTLQKKVNNNMSCLLNSEIAFHTVCYGFNKKKKIQPKILGM